MAGRDLGIYGGTLLLSLVGHIALFEGLGSAARNAPPPRPLEFAVITPPPPPPSPPEPPPEEPKPASEKPRPKPREVIPEPSPPEPPPPSNTTQEPPPSEPPKPVFGISMSSTVGPGQGGLSVRVGNTLMKEPEKDVTPPPEVKPYRTVPLYQVSKDPRVVGDCQVDSDAKRLGFEGQVKLSVEVLVSGDVGEVKLLSDFGEPRATALAMQAMKRCRFRPAEANGQAVATLITYKFTFQLE